MNTPAPNLHTGAHSDLLARVINSLPGDMPIYLVGGAVRDALLNRQTHDFDFIVSKDAIKYSRRVANVLDGDFYALDKERVTGRVIYSPADSSQRLVLDFAAFRGPDLESDLRARDFTINAMAIALHEPDKIIDPLNGWRDVFEKRLQACTPHAFQDDPVRILRCIRQAVDFGFRITPDTKKLLKKALPNLLNVSPERIRDELFRIFEGPRPVAALRSMDLMQVMPQILPELVGLMGVAQSLPHISDVWEHTLTTIEKLSGILDVLALQHDPETAANWALGLVSLKLGRYRQQLESHLTNYSNFERPLKTTLIYAALYHDVGKPRTRKVEEDGRIRFIEHERVGADIAGKRARRLRLSNEEIQRIETTIRNHMRPLNLAQSENPPTRRAIYHFFRDCGSAGVDVCLLALADTLATYSPGLPSEVWTRQLDIVRALLESWWERPHEMISPPPFLDGNDLIGEFELSPGPLIGQLLEAIRESQASGEVGNRQEALEFARQWLETTTH